MLAPLHCRPDAFAFMAQQVPVLESDEGLVNAASAIAMHELTDVDPVDALLALHRYAEIVHSLVPHLVDHLRNDDSGADASTVEAVLAHLHDLLFDDIGFRGNRRDYYNPMNSFLPVVLETRRGIPITLTLIYVAVARQIGLRAWGISAPFHFLAGVDVAGRSMLLDPFEGGRLVTAEETYHRIEQLAGGKVDRREDLLAPATHRQWIARMLQNLILIYGQAGREHDLQAMVELRRLLESGGAAPP